jgi:DNA polymerase III alpha subunit (gram-positive type)
MTLETSMDLNDPRTIHFVDIETTHLDPSVGEIIEICILTSKDWGKTIYDVYHTKVKPIRLESASAAALNINGYNDADWSDAPLWSDVVADISKILSDGIICAHNAIFESKWLTHHCTDILTHRFMCTMTLAYTYLPLRTASMSAIRDYYNWSHDDAHTAYADAYDCYLFFVTCMTDVLPDVPS